MNFSHRLAALRRLAPIAFVGAGAAGRLTGTETAWKAGACWGVETAAVWLCWAGCEASTGAAVLASSVVSPLSTRSTVAAEAVTVEPRVTPPIGSCRFGPEPVFVVPLSTVPVLPMAGIPPPPLNSKAPTSATLRPPPAKPRLGMSTRVRFRKSRFGASC